MTKVSPGLAVLIGLAAIGCSSSPSSPTPVPSALALPASTLAIGGTSPAVLAQCLGGQGAAPCFTAERMLAADPALPIVSAPVLNNNQAVLNSGSTVTLAWSAPAGAVTSYVIEASSAPGGPANLANFNTGTAATSLAVPGVPSGTYYVRVRALDASGPSAASNEVQLIVGDAAPPPPAGCPSAPRSLTIASQTGGNVTFAWQPPLTGAPASYVIQAGSSPGAANLANFDTNSTALTLSAPNVPAGSYFVRVYGRSGSCVSPPFLTPSSNEVLLSIGGSSTPGWTGQISCRIQVSAPGGYHHDEAQTWTITGPGQTVGPRTTYPLQWTAQGSGAGQANSWTINSTTVTDLTVTVVASTGIPIFDRTTTPILIRGGIVGMPTSFDLREIDFPTIVASSPTATSVTGSYSRPVSGGDSPQQPGNPNGAVSCTWSFAFR